MDFIFHNLYATFELEVCAHTFYNGTAFRVINDYCIFMIQKQNKTKQNKTKPKQNKTKTKKLPSKCLFTIQF